MKLQNIISFATVIGIGFGCQIQKTDIVKEVKNADGSTTTYTNRSSGYGYNPNYTSEQVVSATNPAVMIGTQGGGGSWGFGSMNGYNSYPNAGGCGVGYGVGYGGGYGVGYGVGYYNGNVYQGGYAGYQGDCGGGYSGFGSACYAPQPVYGYGQARVR